VGAVGRKLLPHALYTCVKENSIMHTNICPLVAPLDGSKIHQQQIYKFSACFLEFHERMPLDMTE
jgi:hypothetical protein